MLALENVHVAIAAIPILRDVSLRAETSETIALVGHNGETELARRDPGSSTAGSDHCDHDRLSGS